MIMDLIICYCNSLSIKKFNSELYWSAVNTAPIKIKDTAYFLTFSKTSNYFIILIKVVISLDETDVNFKNIFDTQSSNFKCTFVSKANKIAAVNKKMQVM